MKPQAFQPGELRDEHDNIIRAGAYGKKTPFVNSDNSAILDYIMNNFDALYAQIPNGRAYVKSVNNITPDSNGNVTVKVTSTETNENVRIDFPSIQYQSYVPGFYEYTQSLSSDAVRMFSKANVGKQFKVEIIFN